MNASKPRTVRSAATKSKSKGFDVIRWIEKHCVFTAGDFIGQRFKLQLWQMRFIMDLFSVDGSGSRRHRWALLGVPKKNGKTELAAALGLYFLMGDGAKAPVVVCAAASDEQADLVFGAAKTMCEMSATLSLTTECFESEILVPSVPGAKLKRVAAAAGTNDGKNIYAVICDELHEWVGDKGRRVWTVLTNGIIARENAMVIQITTAGFEPETILGEQYEHCRAVQRGEKHDPTYLFRWFQAPEGADYRLQETWEAANPSAGVTVKWPFYADLLTKKGESDLRRYFLNQWVEAEEIWLPADAWSNCRVKAVNLDPELPLHVGIDASRKNDSTAVVAAQVQGERIVVKSRVWANPYRPQDSRFALFQVPIFEVEKYIRDLAETYPLAAGVDDKGRPILGPAFNFDQAYFSRSALALEAEGLNMIEIPASRQRWLQISPAFYEVIVIGRLAHDGDAVLAGHIRNVIKDERNDGWTMNKRDKTGRKKTDAAMACAMAVWSALQYQPEPEQSVYETRGIRVIG